MAVSRRPVLHVEAGELTSWSGLSNRPPPSDVLVAGVSLSRRRRRLSPIVEHELPGVVLQLTRE